MREQQQSIFLPLLTLLTVLYHRVHTTYWWLYAGHGHHHENFKFSILTLTADPRHFTFGIFPRKPILSTSLCVLATSRNPANCLPIQPQHVTFRRRSRSRRVFILLKLVKVRIYPLSVGLTAVYSHFSLYQWLRNRCSNVPPTHTARPIISIRA